MWCYQRPGFEAHLVTELQKQQQRSQFCDTLLKSEGVSVPAHSCILSAFSSQFSSVISSTPAPPAGQSRVVEFRAFGACTLLHMMRLLYSGEMAGEGEEERQEAISAAAKLGIHGLVEVSERGYQVQNGERGGHYVDVGVQTESLLREESGGRRGKWRRQVRDGYTLLWKDTVPNGEKDTWTQTDEVQGSTAHTTEPAASFETLNIPALKSFGHSELHFCPTHIPRAPVTVIHAHNENQISALPSLPSVPAASLGESTPAGCRSFVLGQPYASVPSSFAVSHVSTAGSSQTSVCAGDHQHCWADLLETGGHVAAENEDEAYEQFQGNIPGFITYFLDRGNSSRRRRAGRRRGAGVGRARRAYPVARRPRGGRGMGLMQTVDVQKVGVSVFHRKWVQRWTAEALRTGQGGGATGRKLQLKTRDLLTSSKTCQSRRPHSKVWEVSDTGEVLLQSKRGRGRGKKSNTAERQRGRPVGRGRRGRPKSAASDSTVFTPITFYNSHTSDSQLTLPSTSVSMLSCPTTYGTPAPALLHTTQLPPLTTPPHENHQETFECLLEEVLLGLNLDAAGPRCHPPPTAGGSSCIFSSPTLISSHQEHCSTEGVTGGKEGTGFSSANSEEQQQGEGPISDILDSFLQSFEQHVEACNAKEEAVAHWQSGTEGSQLQPVLSQSQTPHPESSVQHTQAPAGCGYTHSEVRPSQTSPHVDSVSAVPPFIHSDDHCPEQASVSRVTEPLHSDDMSLEATMTQAPPEMAPAQSPITQAKAKQMKSSQTACVKSVEEKRTCMKNPVSLKAPITKITNDPKDEQQQQISEGKQRKNEPAQDTQVTTLQVLINQVKSPVKTNTSSSSITCPHDTERNQQPVSYMKTFSPKMKKVQQPHSRETPLCQPVHSSQDASTQLAQPMNQNLTEVTECKLKSNRSPQNGHLYLSVRESLVVPIQQQPVESYSRDNQGTNQGRHKEQEESQKTREEQEKNTEIYEEQEKKQQMDEEKKKNKEIHKEQNKGIHEEQEKNQEGDEDQENTQETAEENQGTCEESTVLSQEQLKGSMRVARKRQMDAVEERSTDATVVKRICIDEISQPAAEANVSTCVCGFSPTEEEIYMEAADVDTNEGDVSQRNIDPKEGQNEYLTDEDLESSSDSIVDVDENWDDSSFLLKMKGELSQISPSREAAGAHCGQMNPLVLLHSHSYDVHEDENEEYIDVIEGCSPVPGVVCINWMDSSGCEEVEEDEEIDVVGPAMDYASSSLMLFSML
ncbi:uncharacterized protein LOC117519649 [Thalassophryne amazonica]|uniref:uncharacterized protein LOC117519649 n=1 Tax=Thalassophryne amazonica TaxID=390379 RepID=UPI001471574F|nr:uncharacterized protein LOC117519649 [Thalassophryne amazonica]